VSYCTIDQIKARCLITDSTYNTELTAIAAEASRHVDEQLRPYISTDEDAEDTAEPFVFTQLPLDDESIPEQISNITADYAAALFLRRYMPEKYSEEWWTNALGKMEEYIRVNWYKGSFCFVGS
jgi:hypothetical protein